MNYERLLILADTKNPHFVYFFIDFKSLPLRTFAPQKSEHCCVNCLIDGFSR